MILPQSYEQVPVRSRKAKFCLFVPTCPRVEHRAPWKARLARQGQPQASCPCRSEHDAILPEVGIAIAADRAESGSPIGRGSATKMTAARNPTPRIAWKASTTGA